MLHTFKTTLLAIALCLMLVAPALAGTAVNINTATVEQLQSVNGIGQKTAEKIVAYRTSHGTYSSVDQLCNIKGIGKASLSKMGDQLCVQ
ncbi:ComEA family DNA-binding protein [Desulfuromonas acetoxidans]|uniref:Competence protein ComEA helix-hairpin-helix region n=1 Tax=Desulfuromonas acetoxidans (strain DSM 684 / 11070) TaxID=281689 RepID=Q1JY69_DESA6|nr:ComEA family DNA-binding protein [Desulfuromonas acetoxidans]EAT15127.1 Competence protein ComEA helix-hairpin-helix region [Desulfuromonas acetoxidans DSM 684]